MIDISIVSGFLLLSMIIGVRQQKVTSFAEFITIPNEMRTSFMLFATIFASAIGSGSTLGLTQKIYDGQYEYIVAYSVSLIWLFIIAKYFIPRFVKLNGQTIGDLFFNAYGKIGQKLIGLFSIIFCMGHFSAQVTGCGFLFKNFLAVEPIIGIILSYIVILIYATVGGLRSVVKTDAMQLVIMTFGLIMLGGVIFVMQPSTNQQVDIITAASKTNEHFIFNSFTLSLTFIVMTFYPHFVQRLLLTRDIKILQTSLTKSIYAYLIFISIITFVAIKSQILFNDLNDQLLFNVICNNLSFGIRGIIIASLIASLMSTADSDLNTAVTCLCKDLLSDLDYSDGKMLLIARLSTCILSSIFIAIALKFDNLLDLIVFIAGFWSPVILVPLIGILYGKIVTNWQLLITIIFSVISSHSWHYYYNSSYKVPGVLIGCAISGLLFSLFLRSNKLKNISQ